MAAATSKIPSVADLLPKLVRNKPQQDISIDIGAMYYVGSRLFCK